MRHQHLGTQPARLSGTHMVLHSKSGTSPEEQNNNKFLTVSVQSVKRAKNSVGGHPSGLRWSRILMEWEGDVTIIGGSSEKNNSTARVHGPSGDSAGGVPPIMSTF